MREHPDNLPIQRIYFDEGDDSSDGNGWNVVDAYTEGGVAARFPTAPIAVSFCKAKGFKFFIEESDPPGLKYIDGEGWIDA